MEDAATSISECESIDFERPQGRKRLRYEDQWARNKQKKRKDGGKAYTTWKGASIDKKKLVSVSCRCQYSCATRVSLAERKRVFKEFIRFLIMMTKTSTFWSSSKLALNPRKNTFSYFIRLSSGDSVEVCKAIFQ